MVWAGDVLMLACKRLDENDGSVIMEMCRMNPALKSIGRREISAPLTSTIDRMETGGEYVLLVSEHD
jgi:hypothetical protein